MPERIQRKRTKGWVLPPNAVIVTRPGPFGNPFIVAPTFEPGSRVLGCCAVPTAEDAVELFRMLLTLPERADLRRRIVTELRGRDLACWCSPKALWCHADVLLEIANAPES